MGSSASKTSRTLSKSVQQTQQTVNKNNMMNLNKQLGKDHLKLNEGKRHFTESEIKENQKHNVFTERPPEELENMGYDKDEKFKFGGNRLFEEAVAKGVVNIQKKQNSQHFNTNHESIQVLKNRVNVEKQYEGLFIPKDADKPNIPERFLNEEQRKEMSDPELMKKKLEKSGTNAFGLFDSGVLADLIIDYKVKGEPEFISQCKESDVNEENISKLKQFIDTGVINLPSHKVTLHESIDPESRQVKQKLVVVKDTWVEDLRDELKREKSGKIDSKSKSSKDSEVFEQFKMLENLVSKSQISTKKVEGSATEETETVLKRPKKKIGKQITQML